MLGNTVAPLELPDVRAVIEGRSGHKIDDLEFQETLAANRCVIIAPWVCRIKDNGKLEKLATLRYLPNRTLDKNAVLLAVLLRL